MNIFLNKNILFGIILILTLTLIFGFLISLINQIDVYGYSSDWTNINNFSRNSDIWEYFYQLNDNSTDFGVYIGHDIMVYTLNESKKFYKTAGNIVSTYTGSPTWKNYDYVDYQNGEYDVPDWFLVELGIKEEIYLNDISMTFSVTNNSVMSQNMKIDHDGLGVVGKTLFELYNNDGNLIKTIRPTSSSNYTLINLPEQGKYYLYLKKDPTETTLFSFINPQNNLTIEYIDKNNLILGQAYKVTDITNFQTIIFDEQLPDLVYIYRENKLNPDTENEVLNLSPTGKHLGMVENSIINLFDSENTYFIIVDSAFENHHIDINFEYELIETTDSIPYVPSNIGKIWEELRSSQIDYFIPGGNSTIPFKIDTGIEKIDTFNDELIYENKSNQKISVNLYPSSNTNNVFLKQEKRINPDTMETYWVDVTSFTKAKEQSIQVYPNQRLIIQIYQGTMEFEYPLEYIDGPDYIDYVYGYDYTLVVNTDVYGNDPYSTDGSGLTNNTGSAIIIDDGTTPIIQDSTNILDPNYKYDNPYTDQDSALETIKKSMGTVQTMVSILFDNQLLGLFVMAFSITIPIAIFKFIRG